MARELTIPAAGREEHVKTIETIQEGDPALLIVEDDPHYARSCSA
jgi:hypothetical protein